MRPPKINYERKDGETFEDYQCRQIEEVGKVKMWEANSIQWTIWIALTIQFLSLLVEVFR